MWEAARVMGERRIGSLVVKEGKGPVGIVTERDLLSQVIALDREPLRARVADTMSSPLITIGPSATIKEAARTMIRRRGRLVVDGDKLLGIVTASDLIKSLPETEETTRKVIEYATKKVVTVDGETTARAAAKLMGLERIGSVVVTRRGRPTGIFTERDLLTALVAKGRSLESRVGEVASSPLLVVPSGISVLDAAFVMSTKGIRRLPLVNEGDELIGIVTARDLVEAYAQ
jgi:CBS domain-containing protein